MDAMVGSSDCRIVSRPQNFPNAVTQAVTVGKESLVPHHPEIAACDRRRRIATAQGAGGMSRVASRLRRLARSFDGRSSKVA